MLQYRHMIVISWRVASNCQTPKDVPLKERSKRIDVIAKPEEQLFLRVRLVKGCGHDRSLSRNDRSLTIRAFGNLKATVTSVFRLPLRIELCQHFVHRDVLAQPVKQ